MIRICPGQIAAKIKKTIEHAHAMSLPDVVHRFKTMTAKRLKFSPNLPYAFTEHGVIMLAAVLNSPLAVQTSVQIAKIFVRLRHPLASNAELARKLTSPEKKYDKQFKAVFDAIRQLMEPPEPKKKKRIGFRPPCKKKGH